ncbi:hypothetical protein M9Y10_025469 [Tritrichomonas musculus]|uniref:Lunapark zinc ribbon domain-containing protein n=1 Tax=Tritrichomonas musculus TaxID=1915356 RepID=A0ABR2H9L2_9EUKA
MVLFGLFQKRSLTPTEEIDLLGQKEKILQARKKNSPNIMNKLIIFCASLTLGLLIFFNLNINIYIGISMVNTLLVWLYKPYHLKRIDKQITAVRKEKTEKAQKLKEQASHAGVLYTHLRNDEIKSKTQVMNYDSYPFLCHVWDKIFHNYLYNPNALICPYCKSNNGLFDPSTRINYICPNCKRHAFSNYKFSISEKEKEKLKEKEKEKEKEKDKKKD